MAFIARNNSYLVANGNTATFSGASSTGAATIGFLPTTGTGTFTNQPTTSVCQGKSYVVIVGSGAPGSTISSAQVLGLPTGPTGSTGPAVYPLTAVPTNMATSGLALFTPASSNGTMNLGTGFTGTLATDTATYLMNSSPNGVSVGYTGGSAFTSPLNACPGCQCASGTICSTGGICTGVSPCTAGSPCAGSCNGVCAGSGMQCQQQSNGNFQCVPNSTISSWVWWVVAAVAILLVLIIIGGLIYAYSSSGTTTVVEKKADPVQAVFEEPPPYPSGQAPILLTAPPSYPYPNGPPAAYPSYYGPPPGYPMMQASPPYPVGQPLYLASGQRVQ